MSSPLQFLNHSNPGRLATAQSKGPHKAKPLELRHLSAYTSRKNSPGACFAPPLEVVPTRNPITCNKRAADPVHPDLAGLLVKYKNLLAELRNLRNKLFIKETSLQEMKNELESYKENNVQQSFQIMSLKDDIKDLEELIASLTRIKSLKNTNIQSLERGNWDLTRRIIELENLLRVHLIERKKADEKVDLLEKKLAGVNRFTPYMSMKEQEDSFMTKRAEGLQQEVRMLTKQLEKQYHHCEETAGESSDTEEKYKEQKRPLKRLEGKIAINDLFPGRLDLDTNKENSQTKISQMEHGKTFKQLEKDNKQETLLNIQQNLKVVTTQRLEEKIHKLQKQLSDLKLSNKNMKTQLTRVNVLKDKTIEKLRQSLTKVEAMKGKAVMETDLKTTVDSAEQDARWDKERAHQMLETVTPELCTAKSTLEEVPGQQEELVDFRETIMKMLGFNMKTADKKIINHLRLIIQVYEASDKSKIASACETG
ncbi:coiled-coil domain-containing protein 170-like isoform X1 [Physeter macrocephalus]|uniref:Coiled-coil domain-containing protein 170-like isoform X1 n=1 Tax=Physeter macrocephalus TaxID=9755 RepID=A0A455BS32_PHYMC|nr:coiled-coil domain-containing protein 170-like isoform X1 [Physeter catodon]|eukprot:XP_028351790.1 coiled-coil domain-containing protein 170-like isoform X1 [Physeter catodon]